MKKLILCVLGLCVASFAIASNVDRAAVEEALAAYEAGLELTKAQDALVSQYGGSGNVIDNAGGPDEFGYVWTDSEEVDGPVYAWNDITASGTSVIGDLGWGDDEIIGPYPIGFNFPFYEESYTDFYINTNGMINFNGEYLSYTNYEMPYENSAEMIAWFWDDLDPGDATDADVLYETIVLNEQNALVISFLNWDQYSGNPDPEAQQDITAQVILFEDGTIQFHYNSVESAQGFVINESTIGIQDASGTIGLTTLFNGSIADYPYDQLAIEFNTDTEPDASLSGYVYDHENTDPIQGVTVTVSGFTATTDGSGFYNFPELYPGTRTVTASHPDYLSSSEDVTLVTGANTQDFTLWTNPVDSPVLLVDVDATPDSGPELLNIFHELGYEAHYTNDFYAQPFENYEEVWICLGIYPNDFVIGDSTPEETACIDYLNAGGNLYVEGGDFLGFMTPMALAAMFNIEAADGSADLSNVVGEDYMDGAEMQYAGENSFMDELEPLDTAVRVLVNPADGAGCGVYDNGIEEYNYAIFGLELGMLVDNDFTRADIVAGIIDVFGGLIQPSELIVSPLELDFGTILEGETAVLPLTMAPGGDLPVTIDSYTFEFPTGFSMDLTVPYTILPEEELIVDVTFAPTDPADWSSNLWIHSDGVIPTVTVSILAEALIIPSSDLVVSPLELDFGSIMEGETEVLFLEISVDGNVPVTIEEATFELPTGFEWDLPLPYTLQIDDVIFVNVTFTPPSAADWSSSLFIDSDASNPTVTVNLIADATVNSVSEGDGDWLPTILEVAGAYPNPFNASTVIKIRAPQGRVIEAVIYDVRGRLVHRFESFSQVGSTTQLVFEADELPSGLYICHVTDGVTSMNQKLVLLK